MIGSLLFYALYPLSRYLSSRPSEASEKDLPAAVVNGTAVWDGGAVTTRRFTQCQTTQPDQWLSPSEGTKGETKKRMKEPSPGEEDDTSPDAVNDLLVPVLNEEIQNESSSAMSKVQPAVKEEEPQAINGLQEKVEAPEKEDGEIDTDCEVVSNLKQDESIFTTDSLSPEEAFGAELHCQHIETSTQETSCPVETKSEMPSKEVSLQTPAEPIIQEPTCSAVEPIQIADTAESMTSAETAAEVTECWDEYVAPIIADEVHGGDCSSPLVFSSLLSNTPTHLQLSGRRDSQTGWHFPAGPGLAEDVQCPLWQYPAASYYPPTEPTDFEVMWRLWEEVDEKTSAAEPFTKASMDFTIMSYNILADDLQEANQELYTHCPLEVLDWSYRCSLLLEEIMKWAPDILCLQEVQENHYHEQLYPVLSKMGYTCVYKRRTGTKTDGCATCYRSSCFNEVSVTKLEFFRPETELLDRHNVGIVLLLRPVVIQDSEVKAKGSPLCVANTHLLFNPRRGDVKLAQLAVLLAEIDSVVKSCKAQGEDCNLILCGDFNSVPQMSLYQLITTGELYIEGLPAWMISGQEDLSHKEYCHRLYAPLWPSGLGITASCQYSTVKEMVTDQSQKPGKCQFSHDFMRKLRFCPAACVRPPDLELIPGVTDLTPDASKENYKSHSITHRFVLESVYKHVLPGSGNPEVTTLHSEGVATVDYIFYNPRRVLPAHHKGGGDFVREGLKLIGSLSLLSEDVLWSMRGLPNHIFPSDHLSLLAKFQLNLNAA